MDNLTKIVQQEIIRQFKSVRQFAFAAGVPLSTVNSALHNGVGGSGYDTVIKMCRTLGIKAMGNDVPVYLTEDAEELLARYAELDTYGRHTVSSVVKVEYERCTKK